MAYLLLTIASLGIAVNFVFSDLYQRKAGTKLQTGLIYSAVTGALTALIWLVVGFVNGEFPCDFSWISMLYATLRAACVVAYTLIGFHVIRDGGVALYTLFLMAGGMLVPYVWGLLFLNEAFTVWNGVGTALIVIAIALSSVGAEKPKPKQLLFLTLLFFLNGATSVIAKVHQTMPAERIVTSVPFTVYNAVATALMCAVGAAVLAFTGKKTGTPLPKIPRKMLAVMLGSAVVGGVSSYLLILSAVNVPATVLYPFNTGEVIVLTAVAGLIAFGERPSKRKWISIGISLVGIVLFVFPALLELFGF